MSDQGDVKIARERREAAAHEIAERFETWMVQLPELQILLDWRADAHMVSKALAQAAARLYAMIGEGVLAGRLEDVIERRVVSDKELIWGEEQTQRPLVGAMAEEIARQAKPIVAAAARAVAAREAYRTRGMTAEVIRREWIAVAKLNGATGAELAFRVWQHARGRNAPLP